VGGWLGGELVDQLGIGVDPGAHAKRFEFTFRPNRNRERIAAEFAKSGVK
jgi:hypothetical protein